MRLAVLLAVLFAIVGFTLLVGFFRGIPDESTPAPLPASVRRVAAGPPASLRARLKARLRICRVSGHRWAVAYPMPGSQRVRQCTQCGKVDEPLVLKSYRTERA